MSSLLIGQSTTSVLLTTDVPMASSPSSLSSSIITTTSSSSIIPTSPILPALSQAQSPTISPTIISALIRSPPSTTPPTGPNFTNNNTTYTTIYIPNGIDNPFVRKERFSSGTLFLAFGIIISCGLLAVILIWIFTSFMSRKHTTTRYFGSPAYMQKDFSNIALNKTNGYNLFHNSYSDISLANSMRRNSNNYTTNSILGDLTRSQLNLQQQQQEQSQQKEKEQEQQEQQQEQQQQSVDNVNGYQNFIANSKRNMYISPTAESSNIHRLKNKSMIENNKDNDVNLRENGDEVRKDSNMLKDAMVRNMEISGIPKSPQKASSIEVSQSHRKKLAEKPPSVFLETLFDEGNSGLKGG